MGFGSSEEVSGPTLDAVAVKVLVSVARSPARRRLVADAADLVADGVPEGKYAL